MGFLVLALGIKNFILRKYLFELYANKWILILMDIGIFLLFVLFVVWKEKKRRKNSELLDLEKENEELRQLTENLKENEEKYRLAILQTKSQVWEFNLEEKTVYPVHCNLNLYGIYGEVKNFPESFLELDIVHNDSKDAFYELIQNIYQGKPRGTCTLQVKRLDGKYYWVQMQYCLIYNKTGKAIKAVGITEDITQELEARDAHRKAEQFRSAILSNVMGYCHINLTQNKIEESYGCWEAFVEEIENEIFSKKYSKIYKKFFETIIYSEDLEMVLKYMDRNNLLRSYEEGKKELQFQHRRKNQDGKYVWFVTMLHIEKDTQTSDIRAYAYHVDMRENQVLQQESVEKDHFRMAMIASAIGYYDVNLTQNTVTSYGGEWKDFIDGLELEKKYGDYDRVLVEVANQFIDEEERQIYYSILSRDNLLSAFTRKEPELRFEHRRRNRKGEKFWSLLTIHIMQDPQNKDICGFIYIKDIDEEKIAQLELQNKAERDPLSQLYNRRAFESRVGELLKKESSLQHALFVIDIDNFKNINDTFGHLYGDQILREVSNNINRVFRKNDLRGRIGGDEFTVFMRDIQSIQVVMKKAEQLLEALNLQRRKDNLECNVTVSVGVSMYPQHGNYYYTLFEKADRALYTAKQSGKSQVSIFQFDDFTPQVVKAKSTPKKEPYREWILDETEDLVYITDLETYEVLYMNSACQKVFLEENQEYYGEKCYRLLQGRDKPCEFCTNIYLIENNSYRWECYHEKLKRHYLLKDRLITWNGRASRLEFAIDITANVLEKQILEQKMKFYYYLVEFMRKQQEDITIDDSLGQIFNQILKFYDADGVHIWTWMEDMQSMKEILTWNQSLIQVLTKQPIFRQLTLEGTESLFVNNKESFSFLEEIGADSAQLIPVNVEQKTLGWVVLKNPTKNSKEFSLSEAFAKNIALGIMKEDIQGQSQIHVS